MPSPDPGVISPLLALEEWRQVVGYNPLHFWGLSDPTYAPLTSACNAVVREYGWQGDDAAGRDDIRRAIMTAEERLRELLGYATAQRYVEKTFEWPQLWNSAYKRYGYAAADNTWATIELPNDAKVRSVGVEKMTSIAINHALGVAQDLDSDGLAETYQITVATTVTDASQIGVYFSASERYTNESASDRWRIKPSAIVISGGNAVIQIPIWQTVKPALYQGFAPAGLDTSVAANYATTVDVFQRTTEVDGDTLDTVQAYLTWTTQPWPTCAGPSITNASDPAAYAVALARVALVDPENGILGIGESVKNVATGIWSSVFNSNFRPPDLVTIRYCAGDSADLGQMKLKWRTVVTRLACAEMMRRVSTCDLANREIYQWQLDMSRAGGREIEQFTISQDDLNNPLGTLKGQVYAWKMIKHERQLQGVLM